MSWHRDSIAEYKEKKLMPVTHVSPSFHGKKGKTPRKKYAVLWKIGDVIIVKNHYSTKRDAEKGCKALTNSWRARVGYTFEVVRE